MTSKKPTQIYETKMTELVKLAHADGLGMHDDIAKWLIARSPYWRSEGYKRIIEELEKGDQESEK